MENYNLHLLILWAENDKECCDLIGWLQRCVDKRKAKSKPVTVEHLAECSTMRKIVSRAAKLVRQKEGRYVDNADKRAARVQIADDIVNAY